MIDWTHCFKPLVRQHIMWGTLGKAKPFTSWPRSEKMIGSGSHNPLQRHGPTTQRLPIGLNVSHKFYLHTLTAQYVRGIMMLFPDVCIIHFDHTHLLCYSFLSTFLYSLCFYLSCNLHGFHYDIFINAHNILWLYSLLSSRHLPLIPSICVHLFSLDLASAYERKLVQHLCFWV
jgi:hypothetical protein